MVSVLSKPSISTILVVLGLVWLLAQQNAELDGTRAEVQATEAVARAANTELHAQSVATIHKLDSLKAASSGALARADSAAHRAPKIVEHIRVIAGDSAATVVAVDSLVAEHASEVAALRAALNAEVGAREVVLEQLRATIDVKDLALASSATASAALERSERGRKRDRIGFGLLLLAMLALR